MICSHADRGFAKVLCCWLRYDGAACELCASGWVPSQGYCVPFAPLLYTPKLWSQHLAALVVPAPAPAPAVSPRAGLKQAAAPSPAPVALLNQQAASIPSPAALSPAAGPEGDQRDSSAEIESAEGEATAGPPAITALNGSSGPHAIVLTWANMSANSRPGCTHCSCASSSCARTHLSCWLASGQQGAPACKAGSAKRDVIRAV